MVYSEWVYKGDRVTLKLHEMTHASGFLGASTHRGHWARGQFLTVGSINLPGRQKHLKNSGAPIRTKLGVYAMQSNPQKGMLPRSESEVHAFVLQLSHVQGNP